MNKNELRSQLKELIEQKAPAAQIDLWPALQVRLPMNQPEPMRGTNVNTHSPSPIKRWKPAYLLLIVFSISALVFAFPQGRVWAQEFMQFFTRTRTDTLPVQSFQLTPRATLAPVTAVPDPASILEAKLSVNKVEEQSGLAVKEPTWVPKHLTLVGATYDPPRSLIRIFYRLEESNGLVLKEEFYASPDTCALCNEVGASANVETVQIGNVTGEYVQGVWKLTENGPIWENDPYLQTLRWQADGIAYELQYMGPPEMLTKDDLVKIASSLQ